VKRLWTGLARDALFQQACIAFLALRVLTMAWMALMAGMLPVYNTVHNELPAYIHLDRFVDRFLLAPWCRWDTLHYLEIATQGYSADSPATVWPPLYPALIWATNRVIPNPAAAALVVSSLAALAAFYLYLRLLRECFPQVESSQALVLLASFPTAFFLVAGYSEALFLALVLAFFLLLQRRKILWAGVLYGLATLARLNGVVLLLPLAWAAWTDWRNHQMTPRQAWAWLTSMLLGPLAFAGFALAVHFGMGAPWPWQSLSAAWEQHFGLPWEGILGNLALLVAGLRGLPVPLGTTFYDLALAFWAAGWLVAGRKRLPVEWSLFAWALLLLSLMKVTDGHLLVSTARYVLVLFPAFAAQLTGKIPKAWEMLWFIFSAFSAVLFLSIFYLGYWVG
jgi:hypothetical protein